MPSKMVALKELIFAHSSFNVGKRDTTQKYEYSRKQKQLEKTILYCNISFQHLTKNKLNFGYIFIFIFGVDIYLDALLLTQEIPQNCTQHLFVLCKFFLVFSKHYT